MLAVTRALGCHLAFMTSRVEIWDILKILSKMVRTFVMCCSCKQKVLA